MTNANMVLRVAKAEFRNAPPKYYTFDHRRLYCLWQARVARGHVNVKLRGREFSEFARKCDSLSRKVDQIRVR